MKNTKKLLSIILSVCMLLSITAGLDFSAYAVDSSGKCGDNVTYTFDSSTGKLVISGNGAMTNYTSRSSPFYYASVIKKIIINNGVTSIGNYAFYECGGLTSVTIPNSITSIGSDAFYECTRLTSVTIPDSVTSIGDFTFKGCTRLTSITIADSVTSIGYGAFYNCTGIKELTMPASAKIYNSDDTFEYCTNIEKVTLTKGTGTMQDYSASSSNSNTYYEYTPWYISRENIKELVIEDGINNIGNYAFYGCTGLTSVTIGNGVTSIGDSAFYGCTGLKSVTIPDSVTSIGRSAFYGCTGLTNVTIPNSVTSIGSGAFSDCTGLTSVTIPDGVTSIGSGAFSNCTGLTSVTIPDSVTSIGDAVFYNCTGLTSVTIPDSVTSIGDSTFFGCTGLTSVTIGNGVISIGYEAFYNCTGLTSVTIGNSVTSIGSHAFSYCTGLTSVTIGNGVTSIGSEAFYNCTGLTSVTIPDSVTSIGYNAFEYCTGLTSVTIGNSVTSIGNYAFYGCTGIKELTMPASAKIYNSSDTFGNCTNIEKVTLTKGTGIMQNYLGSSSYSDTYYGYTPWFKSRANIKEIVIEDGVNNIGYYAFYNCTHLTSITIPDSVTSIGNYAFYGCTGLTNVTIPDSVTSIGEYAFYNCTGLTNVTIPNSVTSIGNYAFYNVNNVEYNGRSTGSPWGAKCVNGYVDGYLVYKDSSKKELLGCSSSATGELIIPDSVTSIGRYAFYYCTGLTNVTIPDSVTSIGSEAFYYCTGLTSVTIPDNVTSIGYDAFYFVNNVEYNGRSSGSPRGAKSVNGCVDGYLVYKDSSKKELLGCSTSAIGELIIPDSVTSIGSNAFRDCTGLTSVTIPDSVTSIGRCAFYGCTGLTSVTIGNGVTSIGSHAFDECTGLTSVTIGNGVTSIDEDAFSDCTGLTKVNINSIESWCNISFNDYFSNPLVYAHNLYLNNELVTDLVIPNGVTSIGSHAFHYCTGLTSVSIPDSVTSIGFYAFSSCTGLTSVTIGNSVTSIGNYAFYYCTGIKELTMPASAKIYNSEYTFANCYKIEKVTLTKGTGIMQNYSDNYDNSDTYYRYTPWNISNYRIKELVIEDGVENIGNHVFYNCTSLTSVEIPKSVKLIDEGSFSYCNPDLVVYYAGSADDWKTINQSHDLKNVYFNCGPLCDVHDYDTKNATVIQEQSCTKEGIVELQCKICKRKTIINNGMDKHNYKSQFINISSTKAKRVNVCQSCGKEVFLENVDLTTYVYKISDYNAGDTFEYGYYPQKRVSDSSTLSKLRAKKLTWKSYNYYCQNHQEDYMYYTDVFYNGNKYRGVKILYNRPSSTQYNNEHNSILIPPQKSNGYNYYFEGSINDVYWFKYEPIKWVVVDPQAGTVVSNLLLDSQSFRNSIFSNNGITGDMKTYTDSSLTYYASNYEVSDIRNWLNNDFYKTAFASKKNTIIQTTQLDNTALREVYKEYSSNSTNDKIYLLSYNDVFGVYPSFSKNANGTDYAQAQGLECSSYYSPWLLRTAQGSYSTAVVNAYGQLSGVVTHDVMNTSLGIRPAMTLSADVGIKNYDCVATADGKHTNSSVVSKATTSKNGKVETKCTACGKIVKSSTVYYPKTITLSATKYTYDGKAKKPTVTVKDSKGNKISSSNYTVAYSNNTNVGKATAKVTFKGNYSGTVTKTFVINPKGTTISSLTAASKGFTAKWKKQATQTNGYQIRYSTKSSMASAKTVTVSSASTVSKKITGLTANKKYFVQIRTYKTVKGTKYYSPWSATKSVTTK